MIADGNEAKVPTSGKALQLLHSNHGLLPSRLVRQIRKSADRESRSRCTRLLSTGLDAVTASTVVRLEYVFQKRICEVGRVSYQNI